MRRYTELAASPGTTWPPAVRRAIRARDRGCAGPAAGMPGDCHFALEIDHVRASGGLGMKSPSTVENGVLLCGAHHMAKTREGRKYRPLLLAYIEAHPVPDPEGDWGSNELGHDHERTVRWRHETHDEPEMCDAECVALGLAVFEDSDVPPHAHVEPVHGCLECYELEA